MRQPSASGIWSGEEAMLHIRDLLSAAGERPQRVDWDGKRYVLSVEKVPAGRAADGLARPGPLEEGDELE